MPHPSLSQLEGYLLHDPDNVDLLAEAFERALADAAFERAQEHLRSALGLPTDPWPWRLREVHLSLARHDWAEAQRLIEAIEADPGTPVELAPALLHDKAFLALRQGRFDAGALLADELAALAISGASGSAATQVLCLRLWHHAGRLDKALAWARQLSHEGALDPRAAGVASLVALDLNELVACEAWARLALSHSAVEPEALVAAASLRLAQRDAPAARVLLDQALSRNAGDGRTLSAVGFLELLEQRLDIARERFDLALRQVPRHVGTWHGLGWTTLLQGDLAAARRAFETAIDLDRNLGESHGALAVVLALGGDMPAAEAGIRRALGLDAGSFAARYARHLCSNGGVADPEVVQRLALQVLQPA